MTGPRLRKPKAPMRARNRWFLNNRVFLGMLVFFLLIGLWEFRWKPQYRPFYEQGIALYQKEQYLPALNQFTRAYEISPNSVDVIIMMGWTNLKLKRWEEARFYFNRAIRIDPRLEEAQMGASFVALETGRGKLDPKLLEKLLGKRQSDPNVMILVAGALQQEGEYFKAAEVYRRLESDKNYGTAARLALAQIYGTDGFESDQVPAALPSVSRPAQLRMPYRAADGAFWRAGSAGWEKLYLNGVDLGPGAPGFYPLSLPTKGDLYLTWVRLAGQMNANALRTYILLPPAFYRAFQHYRAGGGNLGLIQQVWVSEPPNHDLFTPKYVEATRAEIRNVVDALHGHGEVPPTPQRNGGVYDQDLSPAVAGILLGGELEAATTSQTDVLNAGISSYQGKYVSITQGSPSEVWYAQMLDYIVDYETSTYNWQHPVAVSNGPQVDPSKGPLLEENLRAGAAFPAGLFAAYSAFPYYPESLTRAPEYVRARDNQGLNPVAGYLRALRSHIALPLVVSEYGISTAMGVRRVQVNGWNQGGHSEQSQADVLARLDFTIREAGCAGGIVFELADEWYRQGWMPEGFESPADRAPLWINELDPNKSYGLVGYRTRGWQLFAGDPSAWDKQPKIYGAARAAAGRDPYDAERQIQSVQAAGDEAYLYLRISVACLDCVNGRRDGKTHFDQAPYAVAINTLPGRAGVQRLPWSGLAAPSGVNFLLLLGDPAQSRLLVAESYNPYLVAPRGDFPNELQMSYRSGFSAQLLPAGRFIEYPAGPGGSPSAVRYGNGDPAAKDYDSQAEWYADLKHNAILVRLAWGKLLVTDPSSSHVFAGYESNSGVRSAVSTGVEVSVLALAGGGDLAQAAVVTSVPELSGGALAKPSTLPWTGWNAVGPPDPYMKKAYYQMQTDFSGRPPQPAGRPASRVTVDRAPGVR